MATPPKRGLGREALPRGGQEAPSDSCVCGQHRDSLEVDRGKLSREGVAPTNPRVAMAHGPLLPALGLSHSPPDHTGHGGSRPSTWGHRPIGLTSQCLYHLTCPGRPASASLSVEHPENVDGAQFTSAPERWLCALRSAGASPSDPAVPTLEATDPGPNATDQHSLEREVAM